MHKVSFVPLLSRNSLEEATCVCASNFHFSTPPSIATSSPWFTCLNKSITDKRLFLFLFSFSFPIMCLILSPFWESCGETSINVYFCHYILFYKIHTTLNCLQEYLFWMDLSDVFWRSWVHVLPCTHYKLDFKCRHLVGNLSLCLPQTLKYIAKFPRLTTIIVL